MSDRTPPASAAAAPARADARVFAREWLGDFRRRNGLVIAWARVCALGGLLAAALARSVLGSRAVAGGAGPPALALGCGLAVLVAVRRRWQVGPVLAAGVLLDLSVLAGLAWSVGRVPSSEAHEAGAALVLALAQLVLLLAGLTLGEGTTALLAGFLCGAAAWAVAAGSFPASLAAAVVALAAFGAAVAWAARRVTHLAVERSLEAYGSEILRAHRDELASANGRLEDSNRRLTAAQAQAQLLTQLIVHDLKAPLAVVVANVGLAHEAIARVPGLHEEVEDLRLARGEALRLSGMVNDLLLVSRLEQSSLRCSPAEVRVAEMLHEVASAVRFQAHGKEVEVRIEASRHLVATLDASLVRRLLENLVSNALRYTPPGGHVQLAAAALSDRVVLAVRNDGPALPPAARAHLFEKYGSHGARQPENCGLGLYLCRLVAEAHGGRIALVERAGWTVSFEVELSLTGPARARDAAAPAA